MLFVEFFLIVKGRDRERWREREREIEVERLEVDRKRECGNKYLLVGVVILVRVGFEFCEVVK